jgi:hypothetical protein
MADDPRRASLQAHVEAIARRSAVETERLVTGMLRRWWPGAGERIEPAAAEWVRRWGPARGGAQPLTCGCAQGACLVCN